MGRHWIRTDTERARLEAEQAALIRHALGDSDPTTPLRDGSATAGGDPRRLRGIPAIGRNVTGAITGTDPEREATRVTQADIDRAHKSIQNRRDRQELKRINRRAIISRDGSRCYLCGKRCNPDEIEIDHVHPRALGGGNEPENLAVTCQPCNRAKGATPTDLRPLGMAD